MSEYKELLYRLIECRPVTADVSAVNQAENVMRDFLESQRNLLHEGSDRRGGRLSMRPHVRERCRMCF